MRPSLTPAALTALAGPLRLANRRFAAARPGEAPGRQPVHTVYGGAQRFAPDTAPRLGAVARRALEQHAPDAAALARALGWPVHDPLAERVRRLVAAKLAREPVEDFRIDFEDGYGNRPDDEEDGHALKTARDVAHGLAAGTLPPFIGIRIKPLTEERRARSVRTLDLFVTALIARAGTLPPGFVVTVPKVTIPEQVAFLAGVLQRLERRLRLARGSLRVEVMVETPQLVIGPDGRCPLPALVAAARGRLRGAHFGTYDYTASLGITASEQRMRHPACDFAKHVMQAALAGTGVWLSDGSTAILPVGDRETVHAAWKLHYDDARHSLAGGFYQGWDLHPAQLVSRYAAVFHFFLSGVEAAGARLRRFVQEAARATRLGDVFDDAATGQGLLNYFLRGINCGAVSEPDALALTGLTLEELRGRSFVKILDRRR